MLTTFKESQFPNNNNLHNVLEFIIKFTRTLIFFHIKKTSKRVSLFTNSQIDF